LFQCSRDFGVEDKTMDRGQAIAIHKHLRDANDAVDRATGVAFNLGMEDRKIFGALLRGFYRDCDGILERIYANYPDLRPQPPPQEEPEISSPLRWTDVILPAPVTEADLDRIIFSKLGAPDEDRSDRGRRRCRMRKTSVAYSAGHNRRSHRGAG
jgi:hypothetical protein